MKRRFISLCIAALVMMSAIRDAHAQNGTVSYSPNPVTYGQLVTYSLPGNQLPIASVAWSYQCTSNPNCGGSFNATSTTATWSVYEVIPGTFTVKAVVTYQQQSNYKTPPQATYTCNVTVPPPDSAVVIPLGRSADGSPE